MRLGHIHTRLPPDGEELCEVGRFLKDKMSLRNGVCFVVQKEFRGQQSEYVAITSDVIDRMVKQSQFKLNKVDVQLTNMLVTSEI